MHGERLRVDSRVIEGVSLLHPYGELDLYTVSEFERAITDAFVSSAKTMVVDLSDIAYLDSSGLSALIVAYKKLAAQGRNLYIVAPTDPPAVRRVLEITRVNTFLRVRPTLNEVAKELCLPNAA